MAFADTEAERKAVRAKAIADICAFLDVVPDLRENTETVLKYLRRKRKQIPEAINWADLGVVEVGVKASCYGIRHFVLISEASPDCETLCSAVQERLANKYGFTNVEVITEW